MKVATCIFLTVLACAAGKKWKLNGEPDSGEGSENDYIQLKIDEYDAITDVKILKDITEDDGLMIKYEMYKYRQQENPTIVTEEVPLCGTDVGELFLSSLNAKQTSCPVSKDDAISFNNFYDFTVVVDLEELPKEAAWFNIKAILVKDGKQLVSTRSLFKTFEEA